MLARSWLFNLDLLDGTVYFFVRSPRADESHELGDDVVLSNPNHIDQTFKKVRIITQVNLLSSRLVVARVAGRGFITGGVRVQFPMIAILRQVAKERP